MTDLSLAQKYILSPAGLVNQDLDSILDKMVSNTIDYADLYFQYSKNEFWSLEDSAVKNGSFTIDQGVGMRSIAGEKTAFTYSDEISLNVLESGTKIVKSIKPVLPLEVFEPIPIDETFNIERRGFGGDYLGFEKRQPLPIPPRPIAVGAIGFSYYQLRVEKNGKEINVNNQVNDITGTINKGFSVDLNFKLQQDIVVDPPKPKAYSIEIESNMVDGDIKSVSYTHLTLPTKA